VQTVIENSSYLADAADAGLSEDDRLAVIAAIAADPMAGALMAGTGGLRKLRFAYPGQGKSGSYRTVHYYGGNDVPVFLMGVIKKGERDNLSQAERNAFKKELAILADNYRKSVKVKVARIRK
jgi:Uncharacterized protein conserved in bacteria